MANSFKKHVIAGVGVLFLACASVAAPAPAPDTAPLPIAAFFAHSQFNEAVLSPDGLNIALLVRSPQGDVVLAIMPAAGGAPKIIASSPGVDLTSVHWVNNRRLVYSLAAHGGDKDYALRPGLHAINIDGSKHVHLVGHGGVAFNGTSPLALPPNTLYRGSVRDDKSSDVYVYRYDTQKGEFVGFVLFRLNTEDGNLVRVSTPEGTVATLIDEAGVVRTALVQASEGQRKLMYNDPKTGSWRELASYSIQGDGIFPLLATRAGELFVLSNNGRDKTGLYRFNLETNKLDPDPIVGLKQNDFNGFVIMDADRETVLGVRYETSEIVTTWFDPAMKQDQQRIDALAPSTINTIHIALDRASDAMIVHSYSDTEPGYFQLYHRSTGKLTRLGTSLPDINPLRMASKTMVHYKARDGLDIPAYLTVPKGGGKHLPTVVLVHGGPWVRGGHLEWDAQAQFLASRGYAVLEPEFRGSVGFGSAHFKAGWKQWGQAMQDDIADGAKWAIAQGVTDGARICIAGASYGGYATLMGLARNPELFKCGIDWFGVTDINLLYDERFTSTSREAKEFGLPVLIGDQTADAALLKAISPLENAARITQPLLLAYGGKDRTVPIEHGEKFYKAVKKSNPNVEWVEYPEEGHGWSHDSARLDFWTRVEKFLNQQIGQH